MDEALNTWANVPAYIAAALALLTFVIYGVGSPWYRSLLGLSFFLNFGSLPAVVLFIAARRLIATATTGNASSTSDGLGWLALLLYTVIALIQALQLLVLLIERRRGPEVTVRLGRGARRRRTPTPTSPLEASPRRQSNQRHRREEGTN